jgi:kinesin family protein C1
MVLLHTYLFTVAKNRKNVWANSNSSFSRYRLTHFYLTLTKDTKQKLDDLHEKINAKVSELAILQAENKELKEDNQQNVEALEKGIASKTQEVTVLEAENEALKERQQVAEALQREIDSKITELAHLEAENNTLKGQLVNLETTCSTIEMQKIDSDKVIADLQERMQSLTQSMETDQLAMNDQMEELRVAKNVLEVERQEVLQQIEAVSVEKAALESKCAKALDDMQKLETSLADLEEASSKVKDDLQSSRAEVEVLTGKGELVEAKFSETQKQNGELQQANSDLTKSIHELNEKLASFITQETVANDLKESKAELEQQLLGLETLLKQNHAQVEALSQEKSVLTEENVRLSADRSLLQMESDSRATEMNALRGKVEEDQRLHIESVANLESQILALEQRAGTSTDQVEALEAQMKDLAMREQSLKHEKVQGESQLEEVQNEKEVVIKDRDACRQEMEQVQAALQKSETEKDELQGQLQAQLITAEHSNTSLGEKVAEMEALRATDFQKMKNLEMKLEQMSNQLLSASTENSALTKELQLQMQAKARLQDEARKVPVLEERLVNADEIRRKLHNKVMELKGNIRVFCRVRPALAGEFVDETLQEQDSFRYPDVNVDQRTLEVVEQPKENLSRRGSTQGRYKFNFDRVFSPTTTQEDIFVEVSALVQSALDGYRVCLFAYGQTGSGKTYTMQGPVEPTHENECAQLTANMGIIPRAVHHIFAMCESSLSLGWTWKVNMEILEIYNETMKDLLSPVIQEWVENNTSTNAKSPALSYSTTDGRVSNLTSFEVNSPEMVLKLLECSMTGRVVKSTKCNSESSRSHLIFTLRLTGVQEETGLKREGVVNMVDLAGSERLSRSGSGEDPDLLKEAQNINKSLTCLGNVIQKLAEKSSHVPFRESKLTQILQPSLGNDAKTLMVCNINPTQGSINESLCSLRFAQKVALCELNYQRT